MKRFEVEYDVRHTKEFWVKDESQIHAILNEYNQCKVIRITELSSTDPDFIGVE